MRVSYQKLTYFKVEESRQQEASLRSYPPPSNINFQASFFFYFSKNGDGRIQKPYPFELALLALKSPGTKYISYEKIILPLRSYGSGKGLKGIHPRGDKLAEMAYLINKKSHLCVGANNPSK